VGRIREDDGINVDVVTELVFPDRDAYLTWSAAVITSILLRHRPRGELSGRRAANFPMSRCLHH
jgi:hypothetical protein